MSDNRSHLEPLVQQRIEHFAYPNAGRGACGEREEAIAAEVGFVSAVTIRSAPLTTAHRSRPLFLPRIGFPARETIAGLGGRASGLHALSWVTPQVYAATRRSMAARCIDGSTPRTVATTTQEGISNSPTPVAAG